jgi:hypothetical protein
MSKLERVTNIMTSEKEREACVPLPFRYSIFVTLINVARSAAFKWAGAS